MKKINMVVIGASAGGVEALGVVLSALPADFAAAVVVVLHIPPNRPSRLPDLFSWRCAVPVKEVVDKEPLVPGTVYFAAPDYHVLIEPGLTLALSQDEPLNFSRPSIDVLFESAALACGESLLGIILTGASKDGANGLKVIREHGGTAWVQDPRQAQSAIMPDSALPYANCVFTLEDMARELTRMTIFSDDRKPYSP